MYPNEFGGDTGILGDLIAQHDSDMALNGSRMAQDELVSKNKADLLAYCNKWLTEAKKWRQATAENNWDIWQRESDGIYDPQLSSKKESWQSRVHTGLIPSHRENIKAAIFRTLAGARPLVELHRMYDGGEFDQSENIRDLLVRECDRTNLPVVLNDVEEDASIFGSGFCRIRWEERYEQRLTRKVTPDLTGLTPEQLSLVAAGQMEAPYTFSEEVEPSEVYRGVKAEYLPIRDVFPDPKALEVKGNHIAVRFRISYDDLVRWSQQGFAYQEALDCLKNFNSDEKNKADESASQADRNISDVVPERTDYGKKLTCYELQARIPRKWAILGGSEGNPEELIPARIIFHDNCLIFTMPSKERSGEPNICKCDYWKVAGQFYGRGVPEMLKGMQDVDNELTNLRLDNRYLSMHTGGAIHENALVDKKDLVSKPGWFVRISRKWAGSLDSAIKFFTIPDSTGGSLQESMDWQRRAQERSSANRVTLGTAGQVRDANETLGGMEMLRQTAGEKFAYVSTIQEMNFFKGLIHLMWEVLYENITPEDVLMALGPKRAATFKMIPPEQVARDYVYEIQGWSTMENKALASMKLGQIQQQFGPYPWYNAMGNFEKQARAAHLDPDSLKYTPEEMQTMMLAQATASGQLDPQQPQQAPVEQKDAERRLDEAAAELAVKHKKVTPAEASRRLGTKYGNK